MQIRSVILRASALLALVVCAAPCAAQGNFGINLYGFSYHFDKEEAERRGQDSEVNPGIGARYRMPGDKVDGFLDGGFYRDSARNGAFYVGGGLLWKATQGLRLGGGLAFFVTDTYNEGDAFIAPVPLIAYEWRRVTLNMVYVPRVDDLNTLSTLGFWVTIWP